MTPLTESSYAPRRALRPGHGATHAVSRWVLAALALLGMQCGQSMEEPDPLSLVPTRSSLAVVLDWNAVRSDPILHTSVGGEAVDTALLALGLSSSDATSVVWFGGSDGGGSAFEGMTMQGTFSARSIVRTLKTNGWTYSGGDGARYLTDPTGRRCVMTCGVHTLVLANPGGIRQVARARRDKTAAISSRVPYGDMATRFSDKAAAAYVLMPLPEVITDVGSAAIGLSSMAMDMAGIGWFGSLLGRIGVVQGLGYSVKRSGDNYLVELAAVMKDEDAAGTVSGGIGLLKGLSELASALGANNGASGAPRPEDQFSVSREGQTVYFGQLMSPQQLQHR